MDEVDEVGMRPGGRHQPVHATRSHRSAARLAQQEQLLVDAVDAETDAGSRDRLPAAARPQGEGCAGPAGGVGRSGPSPHR